MKENLNEKFKLSWVDNVISQNQTFINSIQESSESLLSLNESDDEKWNYSEFRVILAGIKLRRIENNFVADVFIPTNPLVAYERNSRKLFERGYSDFHPMKEELEEFVSNNFKKEASPFFARFSAGGNLTILRTPTRESYISHLENGGALEFEEYIVINQRDNHPKNLYKNFLALASGIAENDNDWFNPRLVVACESVEEIIITHKDKDFRFQPNFETYDRKELNDRAEKIAERREIWLEYYKLTYGHEKPLRPIQTGTEPIYCPTEIIDIGNDVIDIHKLENGDIFRYKGKLVIDPEIAVLDLMTSVRYTLPIPMEMIRLTDGEGTKDDNTTVPKLLWRNIYAFKPKEFKKLFEGEESKADYFFGRNYDDEGNYLNDRWYDGEPVKLTSKPRMAAPLVGAGIGLLEKIYGYKVKPYSQKDTEVRIPKLDFNV